MPLSHHGHHGRATASPALYHAQPTNPTFLPHYPVSATPTRPCPPPAPAPGTGSRRRLRLRRNAMNPRIHCVPTPWIPGFTAPGARRPASGSRPPGTHSAQPTRANPSANRTNAEPERKPSATPNSRQTFSRSWQYPADYAESPTARPSPERIEGVSRSLPFSDLLALTSSHMFFSVMNWLLWSWRGYGCDELPVRHDLARPWK
jgi:hypothetical protein